MSSDEGMLQAADAQVGGQKDAADVASARRVRLLRKNNPGKSADELVAMLVRNRCLQVAGVGAATASVAALPSVGAVASMAVGSMVDVNSTHQAQAELVLDIATIYDYPFQPDEKPRFMLLALGLQKGATQSGVNHSGVDHSGVNHSGAQQSSVNHAAEQLIAKGGRQLAHKATQRLARKSAGRALPVIGVATSAGSNILMTYAASQRAKTYIKSGPDSVGDWETSIRSALGTQEWTLSDWTVDSLSASVSTSMATLSDAALQGFDQGAQKAGRAAGKLVKFLRTATTPKK